MAETQNTEPHSEKRGWLGIASVATLVSILLLLFIFPGFVAGLASRTGGVYLLNEMMWEFGTFSKWEYRPGVSGDLMKTVLYPSTKLMSRYKSASRFYVWQYQLVGGREQGVAYY